MDPESQNLQNFFRIVFHIVVKIMDMEYVDLYNLEPQEIDYLVSKSAQDVSFKKQLFNDAERLKFNLNSLLFSFPPGMLERKIELKETIECLGVLLKRIK